MKDLDQYFTDPELARKIVKWANIPPGSKVLEPSAGSGSFVSALFEEVPGVKVTAVEIDTVFAERLRRIYTPDQKKRLNVFDGDFMDFKMRPGDDKKPFDFAVMNPPYGNMKDGTIGMAHRHVQNALVFADVVIALLVVGFEHGVRSETCVFGKNRTTKRVRLIRRPKFIGPSDKGFPAQRDHCVLRIEPRVETELPYDLVEEYRW